MTADHRPPTTNKAPQPTRNSLHTLPYPYLVIILASAITFFLLARYFITDQQFGPPDASYTRALNIAASQASPGDQIVTVAQYHYHVPMNRFRARIPVIGFAQQTWPPPGTTLPLLQASLSGLNSWLVTIGFSPASPDNATEQWLAFNAFKATDEWLQEVRLLRFGTVPPTSLRAGNTRFGQELALVEVKTVETAEPGQILPVEFTWQPLNQPQLDYNLFLQLLDPNGGLLAQHDSQPNGGYSPTSTWNPGEQVLDRHGLALPPDLPAGDYRLIAGLYDPTTGVRLTTTENNDFVELGDVRIIPAEEAGN
jgi:hypothetical protein